MNGIEEYYARRAREYEDVYLKPERQQDLLMLRQKLPELLSGERVLEIACGTGWWTQCIAETAHSVLATDFNAEVLHLAAMKYYPARKVKFCRMDAYHPAVKTESFSAALAGFWWSHVPRQKLRAFLENFHRFLRPGARVVVLDNTYVEGSSTPISRTDEFQNAYQMRTLSGGKAFEIMKNFPTEIDVKQTLEGIADRLVLEPSQYYWLLHYRRR